MKESRVVPTHDETADFAAWVTPHLPAMGRYASRLVGPADRDDVVQEALVRAWRRRSTYDAERGGSLGWFLAIVADQGRRRRLRRRDLAPFQPSDHTAVLVGVDLDLERAIAGLPARQRTAVDLYYFVDLDIATIAEVMVCAPGTVKATLHQARGRLRELLGDNDG
jgi:DNA-directed RNA polymerase specialized sigma24 family protein